MVPVQPLVAEKTPKEAKMTGFPFSRLLAETPPRRAGMRMTGEDPVLTPSAFLGGGG